MLISVDEIKEAGLTLSLEEPLEKFPVLVEIAAEGCCRFSGPVALEVRAFHAHDMIEVEGEARVQVVFSCSRCLKEFETTLSTPFALTYCRRLPEVEAEDQEEGAELSAEDMGLILFHGDEIDLREGIQEQLVMALPFRPVCDEGCKGLCPQCGADLNEAPCACPPQDLNLKMAALKDFKIKKK